MRFMNEYDIDYALRRFMPYDGPDDSPTPNRARLAVLVNNLADWADGHSDGWHSWPKPVRAAAKAIALIESTTSHNNDEQERHDATDAEFKAAIAPIKAFLTRQNVPQAERDEILEPVR